MTNNPIVIIDFGGHYTQILARMVRSLKTYCIVKSHKTSMDDIRALNPKGIFLIGDVGFALSNGTPMVSKDILDIGVPVFGIGYGMLTMGLVLGSEISSSNILDTAEHTTVLGKSAMFDNIPSKISVWSTNGSALKSIPNGFRAVAESEITKYNAIESTEQRLYGTLFHPEIDKTQSGGKIISNFLYNICGVSGDWTMENYSKTAVEEIKKQVGSGKVLLALSGGVDSSVVASLISEAIGNQLTCIFVDHGLMRKNEGDEVEAAFSTREINFIRVDAEDRFLTRLKGVTDPETKRKIIGEEFIRVFEEEAKKIGTVDFLAQGTIYPDIIESGFDGNAVVKSHHNVGGLPDSVDFKEIVEPVRLLFKDEVRALGEVLGIPSYLVWRQPFPGPGLGIRVIGELTKERLDILRGADFIFREEIANAKLDREINQYFAVLTNLKSVGVTNDERTYDYTLALRGVLTSDFMTAEWARIPYDILDKISRRIVNEVPQTNRIVYDITSKPPATIEWE